MSIRISSLRLPKLGGVRRTAVLGTVAAVAVGISGGAALASDSSQGWNGRIQACYKAGENPADLQLLTKGSCPRGYSTITWNIQGPAAGTFGSLTTYSESLQSPRIRRSRSS
jgi:hypothetical protein